MQDNRILYDEVVRLLGAVTEHASLGRTICLDDDETLGQPGGERMSLLLTTNRRGINTIMREARKGNTWTAGTHGTSGIKSRTPIRLSDVKST